MGCKECPVETYEFQKRYQDLEDRIRILENLTIGVANPVSWQCISDRGSYRIGCFGALKYVIDNDGRALSRGYHEIEAIGCCVFRGTLGATEEEFRVYFQ